MAVLLPWISQKFTFNGKPLVGGKIWSYQAGTSTPLATYANRGGTVPNTNPVVLDAEGEANIWLTPGNYKFVIMDRNNVVLKTIDNVAPADGDGGGIVDSDYSFDVFSLHLNEPFVSTGLMDTLTKLIKPGYLPQTVTLSGSSNVLREKGASVSAITLTAAIVKGSNPIQEVRFYRNPSTLIATQTSGGAIPNGGNSTQAYATAFTDTTTFRAEVDDVGNTVGGPSTRSATTTYNFVYPYFYGVGAAGLNAAGIAALTKDVIASNASLVRSFTVNGTQKMYFAYPAAYGDLTEILDVNNFNTIGSWTKSTKSITGLDTTSQSYTCYEFNNTAVAGTYSYTFKR